MTAGLLQPRKLRRTAVFFLLPLLIAGASFITPDDQAQAATTDGATTSNSLTVVQTSIMEGLAPGIAPVAITGLITNNGSDSTFVSAVEVEITSVTRASESVAGICGPSDYTLLDARMPVGRTLDADGGATPFAGASIGFNNKSTNQDACQRATVHLTYTTVTPPPPLPATGIDADLALFLATSLALSIMGVAMLNVSRSQRNSESADPSQHPAR